ncbi:MAG: DUF533 domain-containing protein [Phycisphaerales bacterium]|nr:DUF533 domain-containing protein [Phycisphaerales bacterium]
MLDPSSRAIATIALQAAIADGRTEESERARLRQVCDDLGSDGSDFPALCEEVLLGRTTLEEAAAHLSDPAQRTLAFDTAVCVCDADGATGPEERAFLERVAKALDIDPDTARSVIEHADVVAAVAPSTRSDGELVNLLGQPAAAVAATPANAPKAIDEAALDESIRKNAMLCAALELLPQKLATVAILPLQMKMVWRIGQAFGYDLDRGHIKELIATAGAGFAAQSVERFARGLVSGLARRLVGGMLGSLAGTATSGAFTFASTWAIGQVAKAYYASGRKLTADQLQAVFKQAVEHGRSLWTGVAPKVEAEARALDVGRLVAEVRRG